MFATLFLSFVAATGSAQTNSQPNPPAIRAFVAEATQQFGAPGTKAAEFLVAGMPDADRQSLTKEFLMENLSLAFKAHESFPWAKQVPEELFLDYVLPYAQLDEPRDPWRADFYRRCSQLVKDCKTAGEAAQKINSSLFGEIRVSYNTGRKRANQSPKESIEQGKASCTGLAIILADACRSVGIPARVAGTPMWTNKRGNHTWVEIWDGGWHFTGAAEPSAEGLDHGWFVGDAGKAIADERQYAIWANTWKPTGNYFPLVWDPSNHSVNAVNVTDRYTGGKKNPPPDAEQPTGTASAKTSTIHVRVFETGGQRVVARVELLDKAGKLLGFVTTKAGTSDLNDMPSFKIKHGETGTLRVVRGDQVRDFPFSTDKLNGNTTLDLAWAQGKKVQESASLRALRKWLTQPATTNALSSIPSAPLSKADAATALDLVWQQWRDHVAPSRVPELKNNVITIGDKQMKLLGRMFGEAPDGGRSLWISMHGGGGCPAPINDSQWQNQIRLYQPTEGLYIAPRAPTDNWNLWHEAHIDDLFDRLIEDCVMFAGVNPDKVYLMGYSAGGDGVYQLAPRMADRFAAASMMAGHPNDASPLGLRNLPFAIFSGAEDGAFNRNKVAADWGTKLDELAKQDPGGYPHRLNIYPGLGHWMNRKDAEAVPWMAGMTRDPWPKKIVWNQSGRLHDRFYWLALPPGTAQAGKLITASVTGNVITLEASWPSRIILRLNDRLLDLDQQVKVVANGKIVFQGKVARQANAILESLRQRADPHSAATATLDVKL